MTDEMNSNEMILPNQTVQNDWFLQDLVDKMNSSGLEIGITLQVSGMLVSGMLVSGSEYFDGLAAEFSGALSSAPEAAEYIESIIALNGEIYKGETEGDKDYPPLQYVHLRDARFFNPAGSSIPTNKGVWWRGRICEIGGFCLGNISPAD